MGKQPSKDSFMATLEKGVTATQLTPMSVPPFHSDHQAVNSVSEQEDEHEAVLLASQKISDKAFE